MVYFKMMNPASIQDQTNILGKQLFVFAFDKVLAQLEQNNNLQGSHAIGSHTPDPMQQVTGGTIMEATIHFVYE